MTDQIYQKHIRKETVMRIAAAVLLVLLSVFFIPKIIREWQRGEYYMLILYIFLALVALIPLGHCHGTKKKWNRLLQNLGAGTNSELDDLLKHYNKLDDLHYVSDAYYVNFEYLYVCPAGNIRTVRLLKNRRFADENGEPYDIPCRVEIKQIISKGHNGIDIIPCESRGHQQQIFQILRSVAPPDCKFREGLKKI